MNLEGIKPGDILSIDKSYSSGLVLHVVERLTGTRAVTKDGLRIALKDGRIIGSPGYSRRYARVATDRDILACKIENASAKLRGFVVTAENIDRVEAFLKGQS